MEATVGFKAVHVPPAGKPVAEVLIPTQRDACANVAVGRAFTVNALVGAEEQPVDVSVQVKVAVPAAIPVTRPALVTVATALLEDCHVPPVEGVTVVVESSHIALDVNVTVGVGVTVTLNVSDLHEVVASVNTNLPIPAETPVTTPTLVTVAIAGETTDHVPPVVGIIVVDEPIQIACVPLRSMDGFGVTVTVPVVVVHAVSKAKVKVAVPCTKAVTTPPLVTPATVGLLLVQVPPVAGDNVVVALIHKPLAPVILTLGFGFTVNCMVSEQLGVA